MRALTRSVRHLHTTLFEPDIAQQLLALLADPDAQVQTMASAALTNMVLHFAPVRAGLVKHQGVGALVQLVRSMDTTLRLNGVWALQVCAWVCWVAVRCWEWCIDGGGVRRWCCASSQGWR